MFTKSILGGTNINFIKQKKINDHLQISEPLIKKLSVPQVLRFGYGKV